MFGRSETVTCAANGNPSPTVMVYTATVHFYCPTDPPSSRTFSSLRVPPHAIPFWEKLSTIPLFGSKHMTITLVMLEPHQPFGLFWLNEFMAVLEVCVVAHGDRIDLSE